MKMNPPVLDGGNSDVTTRTREQDEWAATDGLAETFLRDIGLTPTPDAVRQLVDAFVPCLRIMTERGYESDGSTWKEGGWRSQLVDVRKKFARLWFHGWRQGIFKPDHPLDLINYAGFYYRLGMSGKPWGDWGEPEDRDPGAL
jgi:hypothetical protein